MSTKIASFSPESNKRDLDFIATSEGECVPSIATMEVTQKGRTTTFICIPESTNSSIATLTVSQENRSDIEFIALSLECEITQIFGFECAPITIDLPGEANFGDFDEKRSFSYTDSWSDSEDDLFNKGEWRESETTSNELWIQRNRFFNPNSGYTKPGFYAYNWSAGGESYRYWYYQDPVTTTYGDSGVYRYDKGNQYSYKRAEATIVCDKTWYPSTYRSHFRYLSTHVDTNRNYVRNTVISRNLRTFTWRHWTFRSNHAITPEAKRDAFLRDDYLNNIRQFVTIEDPDTEEIKVLPIEFRMDPPADDLDFTDDLRYQGYIAVSEVDINGVDSHIAPFTRVYGTESDITYKGRPIDFSRVPIPCSFAADAIIKLDGEAPKVVLPTVVTETRTGGVNSRPWRARPMDAWGETPADSDSYNFDHIGSTDLSDYDYYDWGITLGTAYTDEHQGASMARISHSEFVGDSWAWTDWCLPDDTCRVGFTATDRSTSFISERPDFLGYRDYGFYDHFDDNLFTHILNYQRYWKFVLQLGPITRRVYNKEYSFTGYSDSLEYDLEYIGFGWGVYLAAHGHRDLDHDWDLDGTIYGPFSYTTHLSEYFEYSGPSLIDAGGAWDYGSGAELHTPHLRMKDIDFDEETILKALEDFGKTPDQLTFTKSTHRWTNSGIFKWAMFYGPYNHNPKIEVGTYDQDWVGLNPFETPVFGGQPHKDKKPPEKFGLQKLWVFDKRFTLLGNNSPESLEELFEDYPYLNNLMVQNEWTRGGFHYDPIPYVELNWVHEEEAYIFSISDDHTDWLYDFDRVNVGTSDVPEYMVTYPESYQKKMPTGKLTLGDVTEEDGQDFITLSFQWNSYPRIYEGPSDQLGTSEDISEIYRSPFYGHPTSVSGSGSVPIGTKGDIWSAEIDPTSFICVSNVSPLHYTHWANDKWLDDMGDRDPKYRTRFKLIPTYFSYD